MIRVPQSPPWRGRRTLGVHGEPDAAALAAAYAHGIARNHGFSDGSKRTAWVVARLFLADNGYRLRFGAADAFRSVEALAGGALPEEQLPPGSESAWKPPADPASRCHIRLATSCPFRADRIGDARA